MPALIKLSNPEEAAFGVGFSDVDAVCDADTAKVDTVSTDDPVEIGDIGTVALDDEITIQMNRTRRGN